MVGVGVGDREPGAGGGGPGAAGGGRALRVPGRPWSAEREGSFADGVKQGLHPSIPRTPCESGLWVKSQRVSGNSRKASPREAGVIKKIRECVGGGGAPGGRKPSFSFCIDPFSLFENLEKYTSSPSFPALLLFGRLTGLPSVATSARHYSWQPKPKVTRNGSLSFAYQKPLGVSFLS